MAAAAPRRKVAVQEPQTVLMQGSIWLAKWGAGFLMTASAIAVAWNTLGLPKVATYEYVDGVVRPIATKVDEQGSSVLNGRIETLKVGRQQQVANRDRLDLQAHTTKDPFALQLVAQQQKSIDDEIKGIDDQIAKLSAQLQSKNPR
jgi:hypothetical protein